MGKKLSILPISLNWYSILDDAVERGVNYGYRQAYKHVSNPSEDTVKERIIDAVMHELCELIATPNETEEA